MRNILLILALAGVGTFGCLKKSALYCDEATPCTDPARPFCDLTGEFPASDGIGRTCIPDPFPPADAGVPLPDLQVLCDADSGLLVELLNAAWECDPAEQFAVPNLSRQALSEACSGLYQDYISDGSITVDSSAIPACEEFIASIDCPLFDVNDPGPCDNVLIGSVASGGACDISEQCQGDLYCAEPTSGECGTCSVRQMDGASCTVDDECSSGNCRSTDTCAPRQGAGGSCFDSDDCIGAALCVDNRCGVNLGDTCDSFLFFGECGYPLSGLYCAPNDQCVAELDVGQSCAGGEVCNTLDYLWCNNGTCAAPVVVGEGQPCSLGLQGTQASRCGTGLSCSSTIPAGECFVPRQESETCEVGVATMRCDFLLECMGGTCAYNEYSAMCPTP